MNVALILAGGSGTRVGANCPKQFIEVDGKPIIYYSLKTFQENSNIDRIVVVCHSDYLEYMDELVNKHSMDKVLRIVSGGNNFQYSVINGLNAMPALGDNDIITVHYGAAPFVTDEIIDDAIDVCMEKGNAVSATPCYQLMGNVVAGNVSTEWIDRDKVVQIASPQCFLYSEIVSLYDEANKRRLIDTVDPHITSLMYALNKPIFISKGTQTNIKITTKEDVELFKRYIAASKLDKE